MALISSNSPLSLGRAARAAAVLAILSATGAAQAGPRDQELLKSGLALRKAGRDEAALEAFQRAFELSPAPRTLAQIGLAEQALGRFVEAEQHLMEALRAEEDPWIKSARDVLAAGLGDIRRHLATLTVEASVEGAEVSIDEGPAVKAPLVARRVVAGEIELKVVAAGREPVRRKLSIAAGDRVREVVTLPPAASSADDLADAANEAAPAPPPAPPETAPLAAPAPEPANETRVELRTLAWASLGVSGVFLAQGLIAQAIRYDRINKYNDDEVCLKGTLSRTERCGGYLGEARAAEQWSLVGFGAAGVTAAGAIALFVLAGASPRAAAAIPRPEVGHGFWGLRWEGALGGVH